MAKSLLLAFHEEKIDPNVCAYCNSPWNVGRDHVIPTCYLREKRRFEGDWLIPACSECNTALGSQLIFNVPDRALWIAAVYRKKYAKLLRMPDWEDDELADVSLHLRKNIVATLERKAEVRSRIEIVEYVASKPVSYLTSLRPYVEDEDVPEFMDEGERPDFRSILGRARRNRRLTDMQIYS